MNNSSLLPSSLTSLPRVPKSQSATGRTQFVRKPQHGNRRRQLKSDPLAVSHNPHLSHAQQDTCTLPLAIVAPATTDRVHAERSKELVTRATHLFFLCVCARQRVLPSHFLFENSWVVTMFQTAARWRVIVAVALFLVSELSTCPCTCCAALRTAGSRCQ